jgi:hypothetical protein
MQIRRNLAAAIAAATLLAAGPALAIDVTVGGPAEVSATIGGAGAMAAPLSLSPDRMVALEVEVVTTDGTLVGTVVGLGETDDGEAVLIVALEEELIAGVAQIAVRLGSVNAVSTAERGRPTPDDGRYVYVNTVWQAVIQTDFGDLTASIQGAL